VTQVPGEHKTLSLTISTTKAKQNTFCHILQVTIFSARCGGTAYHPALRMLMPEDHEFEAGLHSQTLSQKNYTSIGLKNYTNGGKRNYFLIQ
jgi:hypothetical protein